MLNDKTGGTFEQVAKSEDACKMVPSPPKVTVRSTFSCSAVGFSSRQAEYTGKESDACTSAAVFDSRMIRMDGYVEEI
jgi:hypothetical protein